jgi:hypothetical protein
VREILGDDAPQLRVGEPPKLNVARPIDPPKPNVAKPIDPPKPNVTRTIEPPPQAQVGLLPLGVFSLSDTAFQIP